MVNSNYNASSIENCVLTKISSLGLTQNLYPSFRPSVTATTGNAELIVVRCSTNVNDKSAYGTVMVSVDLYAKDRSNLPDRKKISTFRNAIATILPSLSVFAYSILGRS